MRFILISTPLYLLSAVIVAWIAGALFYDVGRGAAVGALLGVVWITLVVTCFVRWSPAWKPFATLVAFLAVFLIWWFSQKPSHDRAWDPFFVRLPSIELDEDLLAVENVRNADYRLAADEGPRFETRRYHLSNLRGVDIAISTWGSRLMCHPMFIFDFGEDGRLCISIEVRYRVGQEYEFIRSMYRQQELIYVVCDEQDGILRRTYFDKSDLYLYKVQASSLMIRQFFLEYANSINALEEEPRWYHGLTTNCTTSIYSQGRGHFEWDWRLLFNGTLDQLMFERERLDQSMPFEELKRKSWVNKIANEAPTEDFGNYLREHLRGYVMSENNERKNED